MIIEKLSLNNFRNYENASWNFFNGINILYGNNGQGKTNVLEALHFCSFGFSHRTFNDSELFQKNKDSMLVAVELDYSYGKKNIIIKKKAKRNSKEIILNNNFIKPRELIGEFKIIMFSPEDLKIVKDEPVLRRRFIDMQISQVNSKYCFSLAKYNKIVEHRNKLLLSIKEKNSKKELLNIWDEQLAIEAGYIYLERINTINKLSSLIKTIYFDLVGNHEVIDIYYKRRSNQGFSIIKENEIKEENIISWYLDALLERREKDIERCYTGIGPHRDDLLFEINNFPVKSFASQGQQRTIVLCLKIAELKLVKEKSDEYPVLLLDDVMSELDSLRKNNLLSYLDGKVQTFITTTEKETIKDFKNAIFYKVNQGFITEE